MVDESRCTVLCICINYYVEEETAVLASDFLGQEGPHDLHCIVLDNSRTIDKEARITDMSVDDERLKIVVPEKNLGYLRGAEYGLQWYLRSNVLPDFVIVSNPDIRIVDRSFVTDLCAFESRQEERIVGIIAPTILSTLTGADQNPYICLRPSQAKMFFRKCMFSLYPVSMLYQALSHLRAMMGRGKKLPVEGRSKTIYAGHGAFMILTREYLNSGGHLQHGAFLFGEEIFLAEQARRLDQQIVYYPQLKVEHAEHATTGIFKSRKMFAFQKEAVGYCYELFKKKNCKRAE